MADRVELRMSAYCGMGYTVAEVPGTDDPREVRDDAAAFLRARRADGYAVSTLARGTEWEVTEPEDAAMVPDDAGILSIVAKHRHEDECYTDRDWSGVWYCGKE